MAGPSRRPSEMGFDGPGRVEGLTAEQYMWAYYVQQVAAGRSLSGAELDRVAGTHNYARRAAR
ncbi:MULTISPECIES: hypothetical protein [Amycolatopsis]|uniref:hypothetical protein n=1 Tax=Amycolatopsis TaxID=1813 RepID=UPI001F113665|nr:MULTISPECIES: hypothetical protein [Amycolatopsis]